MKNLLSIDGWYFKTFAKIANLMILNILFIFASIPIVTSGISFIALVKTIKELRTDHTLSAAKVFIVNFKCNLSKGVTLFMIEAIGFLVPSSVIYISLKYVPVLSTVIMILFSFLLLLLVAFSFAYSINDESIKKAFCKALQFVFFKIAYNIAIFIIPIVVIFICIKYSIIFIVLIGISLSVYLQIYLIDKGGFFIENC